MIVEFARQRGLDLRTINDRLMEGATTDVDRSYRRSWRAAYIAATADHRMRDRKVEVADIAVERLPFPVFEQYCDWVWTTLRNREPLLVSEVDSLPSPARALLADTDASARWAYPPADSLGLPRTGSLAGTQGIVGYIDVQATGLVRMVALHEIAHLIRDGSGDPCGHDLIWAETYCDLQHHFLNVATALTWALEWTWWLAKAVEHLDRDADWLMDGHGR